MEALMNATKEKAQIQLTRSSPAYWRVTFDNPPLNVMGPQFVREFREVITAVEADEEVKLLVFESAVEGFFLNHSDFHADLKDLTSLPQGPTGLEAWPDTVAAAWRDGQVAVHELDPEFADVETVFIRRTDGYVSSALSAFLQTVRPDTKLHVAAESVGDGTGRNGVRSSSDSSVPFAHQGATSRIRKVGV
jgi:hypothetical protein